MIDSLPRYENPLDLLLDLVRQQKVPIAEMSLAPLTAQYLAYMEQAQTLDVNLGIDFAHTAATLIYLKSKALLPDDPEMASRQPDLRAELIRQLLIHEQARDVAGMLTTKKLLEDARYTLSPSMSVLEPESPPNPFCLWDLMQEFRALEGRDWTPRPVYTPESEGPSVAEKIDWLKQRLSPAGVLHLDELLAEQPGRNHSAALFLGVLEMAKVGTVAVEQEGTFTPVTLTCLQ